MDNGQVLVYDRNENGIVDDDSELIGADGDGFAQLSELDSDGDGWLDEDDEAFSKVGVASGEGGDVTGLLDADVGAVYTGSVATPYGNTQGTGVYLHESTGSAGVVSQKSNVA
jgi:hypothetical protein